MPKAETVTVETISGGAAIERLNLELGRVLKNIADKNTNPKTIREINLKIKIRPSEDRSLGEVSIQGTSKLAPVIEENKPVFSIHEADGAAWKQQAIINIKDYFSDKLPDTHVIA